MAFVVTGLISKLFQVIAFTVLDVNRTARLNDCPMTLEQQKHLKDMARQIEQKSGEGQKCTLCMTPSCMSCTLSGTAG
jgi:hypothetical protein